ncbi:MAG: sigma-54-dependent Fis family transcriptional regulator [Myxococcales bacterium]|nr:sigma-54-dependent Fis family transcriptional regulator [Myxococcales bacterium]
MSDAFSVLVVDDEEMYAQAIAAELSRLATTCDLATTAREALERAQSGRYDLILLDHRLPDDDGLRILPLLLSRQPQARLVMMTAYDSVPAAVSAIRLGADDYLVKEASLQPVLDRVQTLRRRKEMLAQGWSEHAREGLLGRSPGMLKVIEQLEQLARSPDTTVLLTGETGVGKGVAARFLHRLTRGGAEPFVTVDCVSLPPTLAESLLFGHEKGAFTGADQARAGAFEEAGGGTILLDEIGDMGEIQGKLLRVLENRSFVRVGSVRELPLRARIVASTNRDLSAMVEEGDFRHDLYQRLSVFPVHLPALRDRGDDVLLLAEHFREFFARKLAIDLEPLSEDIRKRLLAYDYPGNVRELKNIMERAVILAGGGRIELRHLPERLLADRPLRMEAPGSIPFEFVPGVDTMKSLEKRMIQEALARAGNVKSEAAKLLGISRFQLLRRMERHGLAERTSEREDDPEA